MFADDRIFIFIPVFGNFQFFFFVKSATLETFGETSNAIFNSSDVIIICRSNM